MTVKEVKVTDEDRAKYFPKEIKTPDDAVYAYLNGDLEEDDLRKALAVFGVVTLHQPKVERIDAAYERKIPDDLFVPPTSPYDDYEYRTKLLDAKNKEKEEATKAAEGETREETIERESKALDARIASGETGSEAGRRAADKALEDKNVQKPVGANK